MAGKNKGKTGKVLRVFPERGRISVEGVNVYKKHARPKKEGEKGEIVDVTRPLALSNVQLFCSSCNQGVRVRMDTESKRRYCAKCNAEL